VRITEPWDPLGDYFVSDLVDDLFEHEHRVIQLPGYTIYEDDLYGVRHEPSTALVRLQDTPLWATWMYLRVHAYGLHWEYELGILNYMLIHGPVTLHMRVHTDDTQGWIGTNAS
jgi:hypothetical protein